MLADIEYTIDRWEGGDKYTNDPDDPGKETKFGISKRYHPDVDVANLSRDAAVAIYIKKYWEPLNLQRITSRRLRWKVFDMGVNLGVPRAAELFQRALGLVPDGIIGNVTIARANARTASAIGECQVFVTLTRLLVFYYIERIKLKPVKLKYADGWIDRAFDHGQGLAAPLTRPTV